MMGGLGPRSCGFDKINLTVDWLIVVSSWNAVLIGHRFWFCENFSAESRSRIHPPDGKSCKSKLWIEPGRQLPIAHAHLQVHDHQDF
jgi:hypothetical protein